MAKQALYLKNAPRTRSPHHRVVYSNQMNTTSSEMEVTIRFGIVNAQDKSNVTVEDQVDVVLTPMMIVKLHKLLASVLEKNYAGLEALVKTEIVNPNEDDEKAE